MNRIRSSVMVMIAALSMAPGFGRPALEIQIDRLVAQYEESMEPFETFEWVKSKVAVPEGWDDVEVRAGGTIIHRDFETGARAITRDGQYVWIRESEDGSAFMASFFTHGRFQGGTLTVRPDGIQVHASINHDGSLVWAFTHPDGRVFKRVTSPDGVVIYSKN